MTNLEKNEQRNKVHNSKSLIENEQTEKNLSIKRWSLANKHNLQDKNEKKKFFQTSNENMRDKPKSEGFYFL